MTFTEAISTFGSTVGCISTTIALVTLLFKNSRKHTDKHILEVANVEENKKIVKAVLTYQDKKTMSVPDVMRILGLGKTATYRLINQCRFKTYLVLGKMRVDVDSFEDWYAGQFHYEKVNGERPGKKYGKTLSPLTVAKVLGIPRSTANDLMNDGIVEFIWVDGKRRIKRESFDKWYASQSKYTKVKEIEEVEGYVD